MIDTGHEKSPAAEWVPITALKKWAQNPRKNDDAVQRVADSIKRFGFGAPIIARRENGEVIAGHTRLRAAEHLRLDRVPVRFLDLDPADAHLLALADNRLGEIAEWDDDALGRVLAELKAEGADLSVAGFDDTELDRLLEQIGDESTLAEDNGPQIDRAEEMQAKWRVAQGQIWKIPSITVPGMDHVILCGDCRSAPDVDRLIGDRRIHVAVTSPPYASQREYDTSSGFQPIPADEYAAWFEAVQANVRAHLAADGSWFVNIKEHCADGQRSLYVKDLLIEHVRHWDWRFIDEYVWVHGGTPLGVQRRFKNGFEPVFHFAAALDFKFRPDAVRHESVALPGKYSERKRAAIDLTKAQGVTGDIFANPTVDHGLAYPSNALRFGKNRESLGHGAAYPVDLPEFFIKAFSDVADLIFDPFIGSGTTIVAAERTSRVGCGTELSPKYVAVTLERLAALGLSPQLSGGTRVESVASARSR